MNSDGFDDIENLRMEESFVAPKARDVLFRGGRNALQTPGGKRDVLRAHPNGKAEFTPLLKSVAKTNMSKRLSQSARRRGGP